MMLTHQIRTTFLEYFKKKNHAVVPSSPLIPHNDPTLMFVNAGMVPFKNNFTGTEKPLSVRAVSAQKCVRAGGKHNDLENVGHTARHHTFFEMLGNFSFGDYFKEDAIAFSWELLTKEFGIDQNRLYITYYAEDKEAAEIWKKVTGFGDDRILPIATSDNFWSMGDTGPCGPCSEIFYDHGDHIPGGLPGTPEEDGDRYTEIWNLVFMQYQQHADGTRTNLPKPCIDTGMGIERVAAVLQGTHDNFETDIFKALIEDSAGKSKTDAYSKHKTSHRVIADHLRAAGFLIGDGVLPSNEGRGYVLRRIMRRAMRHVHMLGISKPFMHALVPTLIAKMGDAYPELARAEALITSTLLREEERFQTTLGNGLGLLKDATSKLKKGEALPGEVAFNLYDTFGFPLDLTQDVLRAENISVDVNGFEAAMNAQKERARKSWTGSGETQDETIWFTAKEQHGPTDFTGYTELTSQGRVLGLYDANGPVDELSAGQKGFLLSDTTPFYAESGGQVGDIGEIRSNGSAATAHVLDTQKKASNLHVHVIEVAEGTFSINENITLDVNEEHRAQLRAHHSATHLLHQALRKFLGEHVTQKGSLVEAGRLRFDFSHPDSMDANMLRTIEEDVNRVIRTNTDVHIAEMTPDEATKAGALALFGEKYGDTVRVVRMGETAERDIYSIELCGGTHVKRTGDIGFFIITSESGVAGGVRRIEALAGKAAEDYIAQTRSLLTDAAVTLKAKPEELPTKLKKLLEERKRLEKDLKIARTQGGGAPQSSELKDVNGTKVLFKPMDDVNPQDLRPMADQAKKDLGSGVVILLSCTENKASLVVGVTDDLKDTHNAVELVKAGAAALGGKGGGGRPDMAQAGGIAPENPQAVYDAIVGAFAS